MKEKKILKKINKHILDLYDMISISQSQQARDAYRYSIIELQSIIRDNDNELKPPKFPEDRIICIPGFSQCWFCKDKVCK